MQVFPAPIDTPARSTADKRFFSDVWNRYFKAVGDTLLQAFSVRNSRETKSFKYVLNANLLVAVYYVDTASTADQIIELPFPSLLAFNIGSTVYPPNTRSVLVPAGTVYLTFTAVVNTAV